MFSGANWQLTRTSIPTFFQSSILTGTGVVKSGSTADIRFRFRKHIKGITALTHGPYLCGVLCYGHSEGLEG